MTKHTLYYELCEALAKPGCAICRLEAKAAARYLEGLVYENANDYKVRAAVEQARGFCNQHAWQLREGHGAALDVAILYGDVLKLWLRALENTPSPTKPTRRVFPRLQTLLGLPPRRGRAGALAESLAPQRACLVCAVQETTAVAYSQELLAHIADPELQAAYCAAGGLCLPHFRQALECVVETAQAETLITLQAQVITPVLAELQEFIRKHDYRFQAEMTTVEGESWRKALELVSGQRRTP